MHSLWYGMGHGKAFHAFLIYLEGSPRGPCFHFSLTWSPALVSRASPAKRVAMSADSVTVAPFRVFVLELAIII